jgi:hypothetical protein
MHDTSETDLSLNIRTGKTRIFFRQPEEVGQAVQTLRAASVEVMRIDGSKLKTETDVFRECAVAFRMPKGYYGDEEFAPNANAFAEYLDDVADWAPASGHVLLIQNANELWRDQPSLAGLFVEWILFAEKRGSDIRVVFVLR